MTQIYRLFLIMGKKQNSCWKYLTESTTRYFLFSAILYFGFYIVTVGPCQLHSTQPTSHLICPLGLQHLSTCSLCQPRKTQYHLSHGRDKCWTYCKLSTWHIKPIHCSVSYMENISPWQFHTQRAKIWMVCFNIAEWLPKEPEKYYHMMKIMLTLS